MPKYDAMIDSIYMIMIDDLVPPPFEETLYYIYIYSIHMYLVVTLWF